MSSTFRSMKPLEAMKIAVREEALRSSQANEPYDRQRVFAQFETTVAWELDEEVNDEKMKALELEAKALLKVWIEEPPPDTFFYGKDDDF